MKQLNCTGQQHAHESLGDPTPQFQTLTLSAKQGDNVFNFYSLWFDRDEDQTNNLPFSQTLDNQACKTVFLSSTYLDKFT